MTRFERNESLVSALEKSGVITALEQGDFKPDRETGVATAKRRIRCPACAWEPQSRSRWACVSAGAPENFKGGCGHRWNTFDTRGRCPGCQHQWRNTACLKCHRWSLHEDWYEPEPRGRDA